MHIHISNACNIFYSVFRTYELFPTPLSFDPYFIIIIIIIILDPWKV